MFSALLKKLRSEKNLTQGQLAKEVGVSPGNVGDWETGKSKPGYNALASLARIFEVSADYLLEIEPSPAKASDDLFAHQKTAGLICDGSPLEGEEADLIAMYRLLPEEQREQAAAEALEYEKAKKELKKQDAEIDRKGKIAALFCKAYEKAVLLTPSEENVRCWTDGTRMTPEEMQDTVKESRELAEVFRTIADIIEQKILPADWRCADAESEENDAQPDGNPA